MTALIAIALLIAAALVRRELQQFQIEPGRTAAPCGGTDDPAAWAVAINPAPPSLHVVQS